MHISEIAHSYVNDVKDHLTEGQEVKVKVIGIDENNRINLSIKKAMDPLLPAACPAGAARAVLHPGPAVPDRSGARRGRGGGRSGGFSRQPSEPESLRNGSSISCRPRQQAVGDEVTEKRSSAAADGNKNVEGKMRG